MPLEQFSDAYWLPSGLPAASMSVQVFTETPGILATLWADSAGTVPLAQPLVTSSSGGISFWAETGNYWLHVDTETFPISVGMTQEESDLSTGITYGGEINVNGSNSKAIDIGQVEGYIVDFSARDAAKPTVIRVKEEPQTVALDTSALLRANTWWLMDSTGSVIQQGTRPTATQRRNYLVLGLTIYNGSSIVSDQSLPVILPDPANQLADLMDALGPFVISGCYVSPNANLTFNVGSGTIFARAFNHYFGSALTENPHVSSTGGQTPAQFRYTTQSGTLLGSLVSNVIPGSYDVGGVITAVGGGAGSCTIQRVWMLPTDNVNSELVIQYGQNVYSSLATALDRIGQTGYVSNPGLFDTYVLLAYIVVVRTATNLTDTTQAIVLQAGKFDTP